ncbi:MAG TPA: hypothetical protein VEP90_25910 [Methylomirabilota bacterium]|nr:hypothetical protein [Methylomirabilota bacterium]
MLKVSGVPVSEILNRMLTNKEKRNAIIGQYAGGEYIVNRYRGNSQGWRWGYQINHLNNVSACGPYLFRWTALQAAKKELRKANSL